MNGKENDKNKIILILQLTLLFSILIVPFVEAQFYVDPTDPRYQQTQRYIDPSDPTQSKIEPTKYLDQSDERQYIPLNSINKVKSTQGDINLVSQSLGLEIEPSPFTSEIYFSLDANAILLDINGLTQSDANGLYVKLNPTTTQTINNFPLNIPFNSKFFDVNTELSVKERISAGAQYYPYLVASDGMSAGIGIQETLMIIGDDSTTPILIFGNNDLNRIMEFDYDIPSGQLTQTTSGNATDPAIILSNDLRVNSDVNITNNSTTIPTQTISNEAATGYTLRLKQNNTITFEATTVAGFPFWTCPASTLYCGFGNPTLTDYYAWSTAANGVITDAQGFDFTTPLLTQNGALRSTGTITGDGNINATDFNAIGTYRGFKIGFDGRNGGTTSNWMPDGNKTRSSGLASRYWSTTFTQDLQADRNIEITDGNLTWGTNKVELYQDNNKNDFVIKNNDLNGSIFLRTEGGATDGSFELRGVGQLFAAKLGTTTDVSAPALVHVNTNEIAEFVSSQNHKINIRPIDFNATHLKDLNLVSYEDIDTNKTGFGLIAEQVQQVYPQVVGVASDGNLFVNYTMLTALSIMELKKMDYELAQEKQKNDILKTYLCSQLSASAIVACNQLNAPTLNTPWTPPQFTWANINPGLP